MHVRLVIYAKDFGIEWGRGHGRPVHSQSIKRGSKLGHAGVIRIMGDCEPFIAGCRAGDAAAIRRVRNLCKTFAF